MSKPVPKSRLNITYRTRIEGRPVKQKLPFRLLVLGDFSGTDGKLEARPVHSILPGMKVDNFMNELGVSAPIEDPKLKTNLIGKLIGSVTGTIKKSDEAKKTATVRLSGTGEVSSTRAENGLGTFSGQVSISADVADVKFEKSKLALGKQKLTVVGSVSGDITGDINTTFEFDLGDVEVDIDSFKQAVAVHSDSIEVALTIALHSMRAFSPDHIAANVPEIHRIMLIRRLLSEARAYISNRSELRELFKELLEEKDHTSLKQLQEWGSGQYPQLRLKPAASATDTSGSGGPTTNSGGPSTGGSGTTTGGNNTTSGSGATTPPAT